MMRRVWALLGGTFLLSAAARHPQQKKEDPADPTLKLSPCRGRVYFVNGRAPDRGVGTPDRPWNSIEAAARNVPPGSCVVVADGIYRVERVEFGPAGKGPHEMTVFMAAKGARPIFTRPDESTPQVGLAPYVRLQGLWFGGSKWAGRGLESRPDRKQLPESGGIFAPGSNRTPGGKEIVGCTIFGYHAGILIGTSHNLLLHRCRLVRNGHGHFAHGVYLSGGKPPNGSNHVIVDDCTIVAGEGYGLHEWHDPRSFIVTRNVVARHSYGIVINGSDHVAANNFVWKSKGFTSGPIGLRLAARRVIAWGNVLGPGAPGIGRLEDGEDENSIRYNAFIGVQPFGADPIRFDAREMKPLLGASEEEIDASCAALDKAFSRPVEEIHADRTIEPAFAVLRLRMPRGSPLRRAAPAWFDPKIPGGVGPDAPAPDTKEDFWAAFRRRGLHHWNLDGEDLTEKAKGGAPLEPLAGCGPVPPDGK